MKLTAALIFSLLNESSESNLPRNKILIAHFLFVPISKSRKCIRIKGPVFENIIGAVKNKVKERLNTINKATQRLCRSLEIVFKFVLFQITKTNSKTCKEGTVRSENVVLLWPNKTQSCFLK